MFEYSWGDSLRDRADFLDLTLDELAPPHLAYLYPQKVFWGWHAGALHPVGGGANAAYAQRFAPRSRRWAKV